MVADTAFGGQATTREKLCHTWSEGYENQEGHQHQINKYDIPKYLRGVSMKSRGVSRNFRTHEIINIYGA